MFSEKQYQIASEHCCLCGSQHSWDTQPQTIADYQKVSTEEHP